VAVILSRKLEKVVKKDMNTQDTPSPTSAPHTFFNVVKNTYLMPVTSALFYGVVLHEDRYNCFHGIDSSDGPSGEVEEVIERGVELISWNHEKDFVRMLALLLRRLPLI
jgi:hypothetical protein